MNFLLIAADSDMEYSEMGFNISLRNEWTANDDKKDEEEDDADYDDESNEKNMIFYENEEEREMGSDTFIACARERLNIYMHTKLLNLVIIYMLYDGLSLEQNKSQGPNICKM